jgi:hypothetical protein
MIVHLSWANCLPIVLLKCFGHIVNIFILEDLISPTTITNKPTILLRIKPEVVLFHHMALAPLAPTAPSAA